MKYSKILGILGIVCVASLLLVFGMRLQAQNQTKEKSIALKATEMKSKMPPQMEQFRNRRQGSNWGAQGRQQNWSKEGRQQTSRSGGQERSGNSKSDNEAGFYRAIIDNNIFRPLGWRPPTKEPEYTFIGTFIDSNGANTKASVLERRSNQFYTAKVGDKVGEAVVKEIKRKEIILDKNGETITLRRGNMQFLGGSGSRGRGPSRNEASNRNENDNRKDSSSRSYDKEAAMKKAKEEAMRNERRRKEMMERAQEMRRRFENASREDRERMMSEFRRRRGRGR